MKKTAQLLSALALVLAVLPLPSRAQDIKIGYVNLDRVLRDAAPAKVAQSKLEGEFSKREKELLDTESRLKSAAERLDKEAATLSEADKARRQRDLVEQNREWQRKRREFQEDLTQRKNEELASLLDRANRILKQMFEQEKYDLIVQEAVFAGPRVDVTDKVIKALNATAK